MNALNLSDHSLVSHFALIGLEDTVNSFGNPQRSSIISPLAVRNVMVDPLGNNEIPASMCNLSGVSMGSGCLLGSPWMKSCKAWSLTPNTTT